MRYGSASTRGRSSGRSIRTVCRPPAPRNVFLAWSTRPATSAGSVDTDSVHGGRVKRLGLDGLYVCRAMGGRGDIRPGDSRGRGVIRGVRCGLRQLGINRLVANGIHEHPRVVMTNSMCNSGRDSTRPPGPATDRRRILTRDASTSRLIKPSAGCVCAQAIAAHTRPRDTNLPDRTAEDSHRRATEKIRFEGGAV